MSDRGRPGRAVRLEAGASLGDRRKEDALDILLIALAGVTVVAVVTALGQRYGVAGPLLLVAIGLGIALLPTTPAIAVDPEIILVGVLPPLLYSSAVSLPAIEFRRDFRPIAGLSVLLVVISALVLGAFFAWAIPGLGFPTAVALGAILSPTDAVATSIVKRLGIAPRVVTLLEGESLLNDATSLVLLRTSVAAIAGGFTWYVTVADFVGGVLLALVIGALVGVIMLRVRAWLSHSAANTALSFTVPFLAYLPTEALGGSGLVAAVVAGIVTGQGAARWFTPNQRISDALNWRTVELVLEGGVFLLMGLELRDVLVSNYGRDEGLGLGVALAAASIAIVLVVRAGWVALLLWGQSRRARRRHRTQARLQAFSTHLDGIEAGTETPRRRGPAPSPAHRERRMRSMRRRLTAMMSDLDYYRESPLGWRHGTIIVWAGMRGVVTLAAAQTLPAGTDERALLLFVAFLVAVGSLLLQGFTLPLVVRLVGLRSSGGHGPTRAEQRELDDQLRDAAAAALRTGGVRRRDGADFPAELLEHVGTRLTDPPDDDTTERAREVLELRLALIATMRERLTEISSTGAFSTPALRHALAELDADQLSLELRISDEEE